MEPSAYRGNKVSIPIKNIYYMLTYAFQELQNNGYKSIEVENFENILDIDGMTALEYLEALHDLCQAGQDLLPSDAPELKSDLDSIKSLIDSTMYKLRELKEGLQSLVDYLNESLL